MRGATLAEEQAGRVAVVMRGASSVCLEVGPGNQNMCKSREVVGEKLVG